MSLINLFKNFKNRKEIFFEKDFQRFSELLQKKYQRRKSSWGR